MATQTYTLSATWTPVASGPGDATFEMLDQPGEWIIHNSASPAGIVGGFTAERGKPESLYLSSGEYLHLRGRQEARVVATAVV